MDVNLILKMLADETRMQIITLLLERSYCVRALAGKLKISEAAVSQQLKALRESGLVAGEKRGYFMHYSVNRELLHRLAESIEGLLTTERKTCSSEHGGCHNNVHCKYNV